MTRGRQQNTVHVVAADLDDAREQFAAALQRDRADRGLATATRAAREAVAGLVPDGPVTFVNAERARLRGVIRTAEPEAARWETARDELDRLGASHRIEHDADTRALADAEAALPRVRAQVIAPLTVQATADGARCLQAARTAGQAYDALQRSGRFGRRAAQRSYSAAHQARLEIESATSRRWGGMPFGGGNLDAWATAVAERPGRGRPARRPGTRDRSESRPAPPRPDDPPRRVPGRACAERSATGSHPAASGPSPSTGAAPPTKPRELSPRSRSCP